MSLSPRYIVLATVAASLFCAGHASATEARYSCDGGVTLDARFSPPAVPGGQVALTFGDGQEITLPQVMSADGGRYAADGTEFWIKGRNATLTRAGRSQTCATP